MDWCSVQFATLSQSVKSYMYTTNWLLYWMSMIIARYLYNMKLVWFCELTEMCCYESSNEDIYYFLYDIVDGPSFSWQCKQNWLWNLFAQQEVVENLSFLLVISAMKSFEAHTNEHLASKLHSTCDTSSQTVFHEWKDWLINRNCTDWLCIMRITMKKRLNIK